MISLFEGMQKSLKQVLQICILINLFCRNWLNLLKDEEGLASCLEFGSLKRKVLRFQKEFSCIYGQSNHSVSEQILFNLSSLSFCCYLLRFLETESTFMCIQPEVKLNKTFRINIVGSFKGPFSKELNYHCGLKQN